MSKFKKMIFFVCLVVCFSLFMLCSTSAFYDTDTDDYYLRGTIYSGSGDVPILGTVIQYGQNGSRKELSITYDDEVELLTDSYGIYGFKWAGFSDPTITGYANGGNYSLSISIPWTDYTGQSYFGSTGTYAIEDFKLTFVCQIWYINAASGQYELYKLRSPLATVSDGESSFAQTSSFFEDEYGSFQVSFSNTRISSTVQTLDVEIGWGGKPSYDRKPYLEFRFLRAPSLSYMKILDYDEYIAIQDEKNRLYLEELKKRLEVPYVEFDNELSPDDISSLSGYLLSDNEFYTFFATAAVLSLSCGFFGYVLHGKKGG